MGSVLSYNLKRIIENFTFPCCVRFLIFSSLPKKAAHCSGKLFGNGAWIFLFQHLCDKFISSWFSSVVRFASLGGLDLLLGFENVGKQLFLLQLLLFLKKFVECLVIHLKLQLLRQPLRPLIQPTNPLKLLCLRPKSKLLIIIFINVHIILLHDFTLFKHSIRFCIELHISAFHHHNCVVKLLPVILSEAKFFKLSCSLLLQFFCQFLFMEFYFTLCHELLLD